MTITKAILSKEEPDIFITLFLLYILFMGLYLLWSHTYQLPPIHLHPNDNEANEIAYKSCQLLHLLISK